ncbi:Hypothetical predicted protein [Mytilus galloprovincialis]|uniref:Uncharacterized protein n=1 Tax=Mytilus galloprovincialis TaxID=29158 RepID=A0A8B6H1I6_MYTGA|nr:Hypothetical predicted protein [Mytilus galloprovincialis]
MHEFTDGCAAQYKSRHCFGDISQTCKDFGYSNFTRNYFETAHAKGPQDAAGGLLKRQADIAVLRGRATIQNAFDLYNFAVMNMTHTKSVCKRRLFRFVETIPRDKSISYKPVSNIRLVHQVVVRDNRDEILIRELSCFSCDKCASNFYEECENFSNTGSFTNVNMIVETPTVLDNNENTNPETEREEISELVSSGQVIAVYTDDPESEYYLLKVKDCPHVLGVDTTDSWGSILPTGTSVITGLYYDNKTSSPLSYKLVSRKKAIVPTESIIYICSEIDASRNIQLHEDIHLSILQCLNEF